MNLGSVWSGQITELSIPDTTQRAVDTAVLIEQKPSTIVIQRRNEMTGITVSLPAQTVRLEPIQNIREANENRDAWVAVSKQYVVIVGYKDHPTIPNTNIRRADLFFFDGYMYEVTELFTTIPGRMLASGNIQP